LADGESERRERPAGRVKLSVVNMKENSKSQRSGGRHRGRRARTSPEWSDRRSLEWSAAGRALDASGSEPWAKAEARPDEQRTPYKKSIEQRRTISI